jgi:hypothetical protein
MQTIRPQAVEVLEAKIMATTRKTLYKNLPHGTVENPHKRKLHYRAFSMDLSFLMDNPKFNWRNHIDKTFHDCMEPTMRKFMKVT